MEIGKVLYYDNDLYYICDATPRKLHLLKYTKLYQETWENDVVFQSIGCVTSLIQWDTNINFKQNLIKLYKTEVYNYEELFDNDEFEWHKFMKTHSENNGSFMFVGFVDSVIDEGLKINK